MRKKSAKNSTHTLFSFFSIGMRMRFRLKGILGLFILGACLFAGSAAQLYAQKASKAAREKPESYAREINYLTRLLSSSIQKDIKRGKIPNETALLLTLNVYSYYGQLKEKNVIALNEALELIRPENTGFQLKRSFESFRLRLQSNTDGGITIIRGPINNDEIKTFLKRSEVRYYAEAFFFVTERRYVLDFFIYSGETFNIVYKKRKSIRYNFQGKSPAYALTLALTLRNNVVYSIRNFIGFRLYGFGEVGLFYDFGFNFFSFPASKTIAFFVESISGFGFYMTLGTQLSFNLTEIFRGSYNYVEIFLNNRFGLEISFPINLDSIPAQEALGLQENFTATAGVTFVINRFFFGGEYDYINNEWSILTGFKF